MDNYLVDLDWQAVGRIIFLVIVLAMVLLFKRPSSSSQKALKIGGGLFIIAILLNIAGFMQISDYFSMLGFTIISIALVRLFWSDTSKIK